MPTLPYNQFSNANFVPIRQFPIQQTQMTSMNQMPQSWPAQYESNQSNNYQKKLGKPHNAHISDISNIHNCTPSNFINVLSTKPRTSLFSVPLQFSFKVKVLFDSGAFSSAMPLSIFNKLIRTCPKAITQYNPQPSTVKVANGASITTHGTFQASFKIANETFTETFILMETMNQTILGLPFFEKNDILIHPKTRTLKLPHMTIQLTERIHKDGKISPLTTKKNLFLHSAQNLTIKPNSSETIIYILSAESFPEGTVATVEPNSRFEKQTGLCVTSAKVKFDAKKNKLIKAY